MKRAVKILTAALAVIMAAGVVVGVLYLGFMPSTEPFRDAEGTPRAGSIAILKAVELGGMEQWISIRGEDASNPVLLWLHGGPGSPQMPFAHDRDERLEEEFVVVHWDQRGAGKSNPRNIDEDTLTFEHYLADARELITYIQASFGHDKLYLLGHSWGTQLGIELIDAQPEDFYAYIGVSQVVDNRRAANKAVDWLAEEMRRHDDHEGLSKLEDIAAPGYRHSDYRELSQLVMAYGGNFDTSTWRLVAIAVQAPEYAAWDYVRLYRGLSRGGAHLHDDGIMDPLNYITTVPAVEVPTYFIIGAGDYVTPRALVEEYYAALDAPQKELLVFEHSAHLPFMREAERFDDELIRIKQDTYP